MAARIPLSVRDGRKPSATVTAVREVPVSDTEGPPENSSPLLEMLTPDEAARLLRVNRKTIPR